jgi:hypothetical protein
MRLVSLDTALRGTRAIKRVSLPLQNTKNEDGSPVIVDIGLRCLLGGELADAYARANKYAVERGAKPNDNDDPIWTLACAVYLVAISAVDPDSNVENPSPFFGAAPEACIEERACDILSNPMIGRDTIVYLAEQQEIFQDETNPQIKRVTPDEMWKMVGEVVAEGPRPFLRWGPGLRLSFMVFLANQLWTSLIVKSPAGCNSEPSNSSPKEMPKSE